MYKKLLNPIGLLALITMLGSPGLAAAHDYGGKHWRGHGHRHAHVHRHHARHHHRRAHWRHARHHVVPRRHRTSVNVHVHTGYGAGYFPPPVVLAPPRVAYRAQGYRGYYSPVRGPNFGSAVGGAVGGLLGSQIGNGSGQLAATAAGAVMGYVIGGQIGAYH